MKKFQLSCILFVLYVYNNYIYEDWSEYKLIGKIYYYPAWFIRSCLLWLICPIFLPEYWFKQTSIYKHIKKLQASPEYSEDMVKMFNNLKL